MQTFSVSQFVTFVNETLAATAPAGAFEVEGEVSSFGISGGQWVHFDLKDGSAVVNCFMPVWQLKEQVADGMKIAVTGVGRLYPKYGKFSFVVQAIRLSGEGSLRRAFELLKKKLADEGVFAPERKRAVPRFPERVALITSRDAAAFTDFVRVAKSRWPGATIFHFHVGVQGDRAIDEVVAALHEAGTHADAYDVIVLTRGGGSLEDLHVFNTETVARAIFSSRVPVVSAIGHERDVTIADLVADVRAATPSNAAEMILPDARDVRTHVSHLVDVECRAFEAYVFMTRTHVASATNSIDRWTQSVRDRVARLSARLIARFEVHEAHTHAVRDAIRHAVLTLEALHPQRVLRRGYSYTKNKNGRTIISAHALSSGESVTQVYYDGEVPMVVAHEYVS